MKTFTATQEEILTASNYTLKKQGDPMKVPVSVILQFMNSIQWSNWKDKNKEFHSSGFVAVESTSPVYVKEDTAKMLLWMGYRMSARLYKVQDKNQLSMF
jgi:hypothetical protein